MRNGRTGKAGPASKAASQATPQETALSNLSFAPSRGIAVG